MGDSLYYNKYVKYYTKYNELKKQYKIMTGGANRETIVYQASPSSQSAANIPSSSPPIYAVPNKPRKIDHYWYRGWVDQHFPENRIKFIEFINTILTDINKNIKNTNNGTVVHCSAGIGRTGVIITILKLCLKYNIIQLESSTARKYPINVDIIVASIRHDRINSRPGFVQEIGQFEFICKIFNIIVDYKKYWDQNNTISPLYLELVVNNNATSHSVFIDKLIKKDDAFYRYNGSYNTHSYLATNVDKNPYQQNTILKNSNKRNNANYITDITPTIIASQCPAKLDPNIEVMKQLFYEMCWNNNIKRIIMVTDLIDVESRKDKCTNYLEKTYNLTSLPYKNTLQNGFSEYFEINPLLLEKEIQSSEYKLSLYFQNQPANVQLSQRGPTATWATSTKGNQTIKPFNEQTMKKCKRNVDYKGSNLLGVPGNNDICLIITNENRVYIDSRVNSPFNKEQLTKILGEFKNMLYIQAEKVRPIKSSFFSSALKENFYENQINELNRLIATIGATTTQSRIGIQPRKSQKRKNSGVTVFKFNYDFYIYHAIKRLIDNTPELTTVVIEPSPPSDDLPPALLPPNSPELNYVAPRPRPQPQPQPPSPYMTITKSLYIGEFKFINNSITPIQPSDNNSEYIHMLIKDTFNNNIRLNIPLFNSILSKLYDNIILCRDKKCIRINITDINSESVTVYRIYFIRSINKILLDIEKNHGEYIIDLNIINSIIQYIKSLPKSV
jgi:protein tyrosine phosphatase